MRYPFALLIVGLGLTSMHAAAQTPAPVAGKAVVVVGSVEARRNGEAVSVASGNDVAEGTTIETSQGAHVYIVTADKGFISVRPNSSVTIERYRYDAASPGKTEIKIVLNHGVVRSISGSGAQAAKENYRMNTPVVALGIRGTDFSVFADATTTRAEVRMGGIVLTPFGEDCSPGGSGPCEGPRAAQLFTGEPNVLLQFKQGDPKPVALDTRFSYLRPDRMEPPASGEALQTGTSNPSGSAAAPGTVAPPELNFEPPVLEPKPPVVVPGPDPVPEPPPPTAEAPQLFWGRWGKIANLPASTTIEELRAQAGERVHNDGRYAIYRVPNANMVMPVAGRFDFKLTDSEAWIVNSERGTATKAEVANSSLSIDFGQRRFDTHLDLKSGDSTYDVTARGGVNKDGKLVTDAFKPGSNATVTGALGGANATQAGYIFNRTIDGTTSATGATSWSRP
ncbi:FecR family protein [Paracidovorax citrulli]